jgi:hypothetical protein
MELEFTHEVPLAMVVTLVARTVLHLSLDVLVAHGAMPWPGHLKTPWLASMPAGMVALTSRTV